jgi:DNA adenine methylase
MQNVLYDQKVKTPFRYPGGKFYAIRHLLPYINNIAHDEYREPFVGGGSVFFAKNKVSLNWINDIDSELINTYEIIRDDPHSIIDGLDSEIASKQRHAEIRNQIVDSKLRRACKYYYLNRTSYSGKMISPSWGYRDKRSIPPHRWHEVIIPASQKLQNTKITNLDFIDVIEAESSVKNVLLYLDPPYFKPSKTKHYVNGFNMKDHKRLRDSLKNTRYTFLLSYEDCDEIRDMYSWAHIYQLAWTYRVGDSNFSDSVRKTGNEIVVTNADFRDSTFKQLKIF